MTKVINYMQASWLAPRRIKTIITTKQSGYSINKYTACNLATHVGEDVSITLANRKLLDSLLPNQPIWLQQTHSDNILELIDKNHYCIDDIVNHEYDAMITNQTNTIGVVLTADCVPIFITNKAGDFVGAIHAGWQGVLKNIVGKTIINLIKHQYQSEQFIIYLGTSICKNCFIIKHDVYLRFINDNINYKQFFTLISMDHQDQDNSNLSYHCDLSGLITYQLINSKVKINNIYYSNLCSFCNKDLFYSYRRDGETGRMAHLIWIDY